MCTGTGVITNPDTEVLDLQWFLFMDLWIKKHVEADNEAECTVQRCEGGVSIPVRLPLEGCMGSYKNTDNIDANDLAIGLLDLLQLPNVLSVVEDTDNGDNAPEEIPEPRLGNDLVRGKNAHAVDFGGRVVLRWEVAADNLIFGEAHLL